MNRPIVVLLALLVIASLACDFGSPAATATIAPTYTAAPTYTPYPTFTPPPTDTPAGPTSTPTRTPRPTATLRPSATPKPTVDDILLDNGFVRSTDVEQGCKKPCTGYINLDLGIIAVNFDNGTLIIQVLYIPGAGVNELDQKQLVSKILTGIYGTDEALVVIANWEEAKEGEGVSLTGPELEILMILEKGDDYDDLLIMFVPKGVIPTSDTTIR